MDKEKFEQGKRLENRIAQLDLLLKYMKSFLACEPFSVKIDVGIFNQTTTSPIYSINGRSESESHYLTDTDDGKFIIQQIQSRINDLKKEFDNL